jgi:hypothetical protein
MLTIGRRGSWVGRQISGVAHGRRDGAARRPLAPSAETATPVFKPDPGRGRRLPFGLRHASCWLPIALATSRRGGRHPGAGCLSEPTQRVGGRAESLMDRRVSTACQITTARDDRVGTLQSARLRVRAGAAIGSRRRSDAARSPPPASGDRKIDGWPPRT